MKNWHKIVIFHWFFNKKFWNFLRRPGGGGSGRSAPRTFNAATPRHAFGLVQKIPPDPRTVSIYAQYRNFITEMEENNCTNASEGTKPRPQTSPKLDFPGECARSRQNEKGGWQTSSARMRSSSASTSATDASCWDTRKATALLTFTVCALVIFNRLKLTSFYSAYMDHIAY